MQTVSWAASDSHKTVHTYPVKCLFYYLLEISYWSQFVVVSVQTFFHCISADRNENCVNVRNMDGWNWFHFLKNPEKGKKLILISDRKLVSLNIFVQLSGQQHSLLHTINMSNLETTFFIHSTHVTANASFRGRKSLLDLFTFAGG